MSDLVERVAIAISGAPFATEKSRKKARAVIALVRKAALEEAAKLMEERTARRRTIYALQNDIRNNIPPCEHAAAIRKLGEK